MKKLILIMIIVSLFSFNYVNGQEYFASIGANTVIENLATGVFNDTTGDPAVLMLSRDTNRERRGYVMYNLSNITGNSVLSANLSINFSDLLNANAAINFTSTYCDDTFNTGTLTWNNQATEVTGCNASAFATNSITTFTANVAYEWDITALVNDELDGGDGLFTLKHLMNPDDYDGNARRAYFYNNLATNSFNKRPKIILSLAPVTNFSVTLKYPTNETHYHLVGANISKVYNGTISATSNKNANCTINNTNWNLVATNTTVHGWINNTALADANYSIRLSCINGAETQTKDFWFIIDTTDPNIDIFSPLNNSIQYNNMTLNVSYSDLYLYRANTTIYRESDNTIVYSNYSGDLSGLNVYYNITQIIDLDNGSFPIGNYRTLFEAVDTHTKKDFKENPKLEKIKLKNSYKTDLNLEKGKFTIEHPLDMDISTIKEKDRIKFKHTKTKLENTDIYIEGEKLIYLPQSEYPCHFIVNNNYWYDCVGYKNPKVSKINDTRYKIEFNMDKPEVITESLGGLNYVNKTTYFYKVNATLNNVSQGDTFSPPDSNFTYISTDNFTISTLIVNNTCVIISGSALYDGDYCYDLNSLYLDDVIAFVNMTPVKCFANLSNIIGSTIPTYGKWFNKTADLIKIGNMQSCEHNKICTLDTLNNTLITFNNSYSCKANITTGWFTYESDSSSSIASDSIGTCQVPNLYKIANISYYDEVDFSSITASNSYDLIFSDGLGTFNLQGNFSETANHSFCTSVNPANDTVNLNMWGDFTLKKSLYSTRVLNYIQSNAFLVSNNPVNNISFYMIKLNESAVIQYTWRTTSFQFIDGLMLIYRCNDDGTKTLLSSQPVANGFASANLQLFTIPYSYEIIINNVTYTDATFSTCHVENVQQRDFYVDVDLIDILPAIGLFLVDCEMTKPSNTTARITWTANPQDTSRIYGCMVGKQTTVFGETEIFRNCSNSSIGDFTRTIPYSTTPIIVTGEMWQNNNKGYCQQTLTFYEDKLSNVGIIGLTGLFAALIIILISTYLLYSESGTSALVGVIIGYCLSFLIGFIVVQWKTILIVMIIAITVALIARYTKKSQLG